ncbi:MAG: hypothetical protein AAF340_02860 [Pseudomonadota bacterium]
MTTALIDKRSVMVRAWEATRFLMKEFGYAARQLRSVFANALRKAWADERVEIALISRDVDSLQWEINDIENRTRMTHVHFQRIDALRGAIGRIRAAEEAADMAEKRERIEAAKGQICSVTFIKKDGSERTMKVQPAKLKFHVKGDDATEAGKKAVATRKARHPHLFAVWDVEAQAPRSINLKTITHIAAGGHCHVY